MCISRFSEDGKRTEPLWHHLSKTANTAKLFGDRIGLGRTAFLLGLVHDIGKYSEEFQNYILKELEKKASSEEKTNYAKKVDHGVHGAKFIYEHYRKKDKFAADMLALVICYHHGGLPDCVDYDDNNKNRIINRIKNADKTSYAEACKGFTKENTSYNIDELFEEACKEINVFKEKTLKLTEEMKKEAVEQIGLQAYKALPQGAKPSRSFYDHLTIKTLYSILIDVDRLESYNFEAETEYSPSDSAKLFAASKELLEKKLQSFAAQDYSNASEQRMAALRNNISLQCKGTADRPNGIYKLSVPTGGGKTYASFRFAFDHAIKNGCERIIYVALYKTIIDQNAKSIREVTSDKNMMLEFHSDIVENDKIERFKLISERFDAPVICTSLVQFLNAFYASGTNPIRRLHNFANSVIIFDEVQSVPIKCLSLFNECINFTAALLNSTVVLCSATQPPQEAFKHPVKLQNNCELVRIPSEMKDYAHRVTLYDETKKESYTLEEAVDFICEKKEHTRNILVVANTIRSAHAIYKGLKNDFDRESGTKLFYLSTHMCPAHRKDVLREIKEALENDVSLICVSTQLIEAGVDISFRCGVRVLAGLDSIAQASGRVNRNGLEETADFYVINLQNDGSENIRDIHIGSMITKTVLALFHKNPERYGNDLLSEKLLDEYYNYYYRDERIRNRTEYLFENADLFMMLCSPKARITDDFSFGAYFKTAAKAFNVIDEDKVSVIVPYGKGAELTDALIKAYVEPLDKNHLPESCYKQIESMDFGLQYHSLSYPDENGKNGIGALTAKFWYPKMERGVIKYCRPEDCPKERVLKDSAEYKIFTKEQNYSGLSENGILDGYSEKEALL